MKIDAVAELLDDDPQDLGDVVVLLDELLADPEALGGAQQRLLESAVLEEPHFACHSRASAGRRGGRSRSG